MEIYRMVLVCTSGWNRKVKGNLWEIDTKGNGKMVCVKASVCFTMQTVRNMKENGITIWKKDMLFSPKTMEISFKGITKQIDWWNKRRWKEIFVSSLHNMRKISWVKLYDRDFLLGFSNKKYVFLKIGNRLKGNCQGIR